MSDGENGPLDRVFRRFRDRLEGENSPEIVWQLGHQLIDDFYRLWRVATHVTWLHESGVAEVQWAVTQSARFPPDVASDIESCAVSSHSVFQFSTNVFLECCETLADFSDAADRLSLTLTGDGANDVDVWVNGVGGRCFLEAIGLCCSRAQQTILDAVWSTSLKESRCEGWDGTTPHVIPPECVVPAFVSLVQIFPTWELPENLHAAWREEFSTIVPYAEGNGPANEDEDSGAIRSVSVTLAEALEPKTRGQTSPRIVRYLWDHRYPVAINAVISNCGAWDHDNGPLPSSFIQTAKRINEAWLRSEDDRIKAVSIEISGSGTMARITGDRQYTS